MRYFGGNTRKLKYQFSMDSINTFHNNIQQRTNDGHPEHSNGNLSFGCFEAHCGNNDIPNIGVIGSMWMQ